MQELQSKLAQQTKTDLTLRKTNSSVKLTSDPNNNNNHSADFNLNSGGGGANKEELRLGQEFFLRKKQAEVPEWKQKLIEKKRQSRISLAAGGW